MSDDKKVETEARFNELMDGESGQAFEDAGCNALEGLKIINSILPNRGVEAASHDIIYSVSACDLIEAGILESQVLKLRELNWMCDGGLSCFV